MKRFLIGLAVGVFLGLPPGFALGVYFLPILIAEEGANEAALARASEKSLRAGEFRRDLADSDSAHWGEGKIMLSQEEGDRRFLTLAGEIAPGPNYKLYLTPRFVETESDFLAIKSESIFVADIKAFENFRVEILPHIDSDAYPAVLIWCERFRQFITAAELR